MVLHMSLQVRSHRLSRALSSTAIPAQARALEAPRKGVCLNLVESAHNFSATSGVLKIMAARLAAAQGQGFRYYRGANCCR